MDYTPSWRRRPRRAALRAVPFVMASVVLPLFASVTLAVEPFCPAGSAPDPHVIWCDDFDDGVPHGQKYFEYDTNGGDFIPVAGQGLGGTTGVQVRWQPGEVSAGGFKRTFGRSPVNSQSHSTQDFREIHWRLYLKMQAGWTGNPGKLTRATILATSNWAQAMVAHLWDGPGDTLAIDPVSGIDPNGNLVTTQYNDFAHFAWLGLRAGSTPVFSSPLSGQWRCIETHVKLNTPGAADGIFEFWIDGNLEARRADLNWVGVWQSFGVNAVFFENYWNSGASGDRVRYFDNVVISTQRIGCVSAGPPNAPTGLTVR